MYNRYIPQDQGYTWVGGQQQGDPPGRAAGPAPGQGAGGGRLSELFTGKGGLSALLAPGEGRGISSLLRTLHLDGIDSGDILLLLIMLYLLLEGDELELAIALGLVLIMGLGGDDRKEQGQP